MIFLNNISFVYILLFIVAFNLLQRFTSSKTLLNLALLGGSLLILNLLTGLSSLGILLGVSALTFWAGRFLSRKQEGAQHWMLVFIGILIGLFVVKNYSIAELSLLSRIGLSYILFRLIHFLVDSSRKQIKNYDLLSFLNYILFFPTFLAGPIDDYNNFNYWIKQHRRTYRTQLAKAGLFRIFVGIIKKFLFVPIIISYATDFSLFADNDMWQGQLVGSLFLYSAYILFDFSGYSDMAIGTAYLMGIRTPENFDNPYFSRNLSTFWKKWHMTFSNFLFKYVFKPIVTGLSKRMPNAPRLPVSFVGYLLTFTICGIWHGNTLNFIYWGLWHALGLIGFKLWDKYLRGNYQQFLGGAVTKKIHDAAGILVTFLFVTLGWFFFHYSSNQIGLIGNNLLHSNAKELQVTPVQMGALHGFKVTFPATAETLDIEYASAKSDSVSKIHGTPKSEDNSYYLFPAEQEKELYEIKARTTPSEPWQTQLVYLQLRAHEPSDLQQYFFGPPAVMTTLKGNNDHVFLQLLAPELQQQQIEAKAEHIPKYGWAIGVYYLPNPQAKVAIDLRPAGGEWKNYVPNRDGQYAFMHLHGNITFEGESRHLAPGEYEVRMRYVITSTLQSDWFYSTVQIPDYDGD